MSVSRTDGVDASSANPKREKKGLISFSCPKFIMFHNWEYKFVSVGTKPHLLMVGASIDPKQLDEFNQLGIQGWELAGTVPLLGYKPALAGGGTTTVKILFVFKRETN